MFCVFIWGAFPPSHCFFLNHSLPGLALLLHALLCLHLLLLHLLLLSLDGVLRVRVGTAVTVGTGGVGVAIWRRGLPASRVGEVVAAVGSVGWGSGLASAALLDGRHVLVRGQETRVLDLLGLGHVRLGHVHVGPVIEALVVLLL